MCMVMRLPSPRSSPRNILVLGCRGLTTRIPACLLAPLIGSIGVVTGKFNLAELYERVG